MSPRPDILLLNAALHTARDPQLPHQIAAWNLLQSKLSADVLRKFQTLYRNACVNGEEGENTLSVADGSTEANIRLVNAALYHEGLAHQEEAWMYLQEAVTSDALLAFQDAFRSGPPPVSQPKPEPKAQYNGRRITLPGGETVFTDQPIIPGGSFSWGEATHGGDRASKLTREHVQNIVELATQLQRARREIGKPFRVTSWYRPEPWNSRAGGARMSQHLAGRGVDVVVEGFSGRALGERLSWWPGGRGIYPGNRRHILHLDIGPKRRWGF